MWRPKSNLAANSTEVSLILLKFYADRRARKDKQKSMFDADETNMVDGKITEEGNFHVRE